MTRAHDVLLVGGGGAGLRAAIAIAETNPRLSIGRGVEGLSDAQPHRVRGRRRRRSHPLRRQPRRARLRHHLRRRLAVRSGCRRGVREGSAPGAAAPRALGLSLEPRNRRPHRRTAVRRHEEDADVVCRRQDRLPHAPHAVPDLAEVHERRALRRVVRHEATRGRGPGSGGGGDRPDVGEDRDDRRRGP